MLRTYGLEQEDSTATEENKVHVWKVILDSIDSNRDGVVSAEEFEAFCAAGNTLPDFGVGLLNRLLWGGQGGKGVLIAGE